MAVATLALDRAPEIKLVDETRRNLEASGVEHGVTAVLLNFRSFDTLLEMAVLAITAIGVLAVQPFPPRCTRPWPRRVPLAIDGLVRILVPVITLLAGWLLVAGTTRPGGAFQAGALAAAGLVLLYLAGWAGAVPAHGALRPVLFIGLAGFVLAAFGTALVGQGWLVFDVAWAEGAIIAIELLLMISIATGLAVIFVAVREPGTDGTAVTSGPVPAHPTQTDLGERP